MNLFTHARTAYILRWNKPDYNEIVGVFGTQADLDLFLREHFTPHEIGSDILKTETGRYYEKVYK